MAKRIYVNTVQSNYFVNNSLSIGQGIPISGHYKVGDIVISNSQMGKIFGWVCVKEGDPGEWDVICDIVTLENTVNNNTINIQKIISEFKNYKLTIEDIDDIIDDLKAKDSDVQDQIDNLKNEVKQNAFNEKVIDDNLQDQINNLKSKDTDVQNQITDLRNEVRQNAIDEKTIDANLQDQIDVLKEADVILDGKIHMIKKSLVDALIEKGLDVNINTSWKDLFLGILDRIPQDISCTGIKLNKSEIFLEVGDIETLIATKTPVDATDEIIWLTDNSTVVAIDAGGKITAINPGNAIISVICGSQIAICHVKVTVTCTGLSLNKTSLSFTTLNSSQTITATPTPSNTTDVITWKSSNTNIATVNNGVVTSKAEGSCTITATCGNRTANCTVVVDDGIIECTGLSLNKTSLSFTTLNSSQTITATPVPSNTTDTIIWASTNTSVATVNNGVVTSKAEGSCTITVICGSKKATCNVVVDDGIVECTGLSLNKSSLSFTTLNSSQTITATPVPSNTTDVITWKSSNTSVATVNNNGVVTSKAEGSCTITATCGSKTANCTVVVDDGIVECTGLSLNKSSLSFSALNSSQTITATPTPSNTTDFITWKSTNTSVATVNNGVVTSKAEGSCTITATCGSKTANCTVVVDLNDDITVTQSSVTVNTDSGKVILDMKEYFKLNNININFSNVTWSLRNTSGELGSISNEGILTIPYQNVATGVVTASYGNNSASITVIAIMEKTEINVLKFNTTSYYMNVGETYQLANLLILLNGYTFDDVTWSSSNNEKVAVNYMGDITGLADGYATISAVCDGKVATIQVYVNDVIIECTSLSFNVSEVLVGKDRTEPYNMMEHLNYRPLTILPSYINWSVSNTSLATIDNSGLVTIKGVTGTCNIVAKCGDKTATCPFVIYDGSNIDCTSISFSQASVNITQLANYDLNQLLNIVPEDCNLPVEWYCDTDILTVENGIVTPLKNGSAKVQARCGDLSANINVIINVVEEEEPKPDSGIILFKDGTEYNDTIFRNLCLASGEVSDYIYYNLTHSRQHMWLSFDGYVDFNNYDRVDVTLYTEYSSQQPNLGIGIASKSGQCGYNSESTWEGIHQSYKTVMTNKTKTTYSLNINYTGAGYLLLWMNNGETNISGGVYITEIVVYPKQ